MDHVDTENNWLKLLPIEFDVLSKIYIFEGEALSVFFNPFYICNEFTSLFWKLQVR